MLTDVACTCRDSACTEASSFCDARPVLWPAACKSERDDDDDGLRCAESLGDFDSDNTILLAFEPVWETQFQLEVDYASLFSADRFFVPIAWEPDRGSASVVATPSLSEIFLQ